MKNKFIIFTIFLLIFSLFQFTSDKKKPSSSKVKPVKLNIKTVSSEKVIIMFLKPMQDSCIFNPTTNNYPVTLYEIISGPGPFNIYLYDKTKTTLIKKLYSNAPYIKTVSGIINVLKNVKSGMYTLKATNDKNEQLVGFSTIFMYKNNFKKLTSKKKISVSIKTPVIKKD